jgi:hypothetical protein
MKHFHFFVGCMTAVLLLSACQSSQSNVLGDPAPPPQTLCEGNMAWSAEVRTDEVMDYTTFWIAFDAATFQDYFKYVDVEVTLDGQSVAEQMKYMGAVEPHAVTCTKSGLQFEASRVKYTLVLPVLSPGEHIIRWSFTIKTNIGGGGFEVPSPMAAEYPITLHVEQ